MLRKARFFFIICILACAGCIAACADELYRPLSLGCYGNDVVEVKQALRAQGYYSKGASLTSQYTADTVKRVSLWQEEHGFDGDGSLTVAQQHQLFHTSPSQAENTQEDAQYRLLRQGASGNDVAEAKQRLQKLGYFTKKAETGEYNALMSQAVTAWKQHEGLGSGANLSPLDQAILFGTATGGTDLSKVSPTPSAAVSATPPPAGTVSHAQTERTSSVSFAPTQKPDSYAPTTTPRASAFTKQLPARTQDGFLADAQAEPFMYASRDEGLWYYISQNLSIRIVRYYNQKQNITWFECDLRCAPDHLPEALMAAGSRSAGHNYISPLTLGKNSNAIFAISDDFFGYRWYNKITQGVIIRNGTVYSDDTYPANTKKWPSLEVLALFADGTMEVFESDDHTAEEYLAMGAVHTFAFGPALVKDGIVNNTIYTYKEPRNTDREPRTALGFVAPYHYVAVVAKGRTSDSKGVTLHWLAERMQALGCRCAINLDGGNTSALYFMGDVLNKAKNSTSYRDISGMIGWTLSEDSPK